MIIESLDLKSFRNYESLSIEFHPKLNVFLGENAQGKTNLLEAIYYLALAKSHRSSKDRALINWDESVAFVSGIIRTKREAFPLAISVSKEGKRAKVNHLEVAKLSDFIGHLNVVLFAPEDLEIVKGAPQVRRKFINVECGQISKIYLNALSNYQKILQQKNHYLKDRNIDRTMLDVLNSQLSEYAVIIINKRRKFITLIEQYAREIHSDITNGKEHLSIQYNQNMKVSHDSPEVVYEDIKALFDAHMDKEIERMQSLTGPHRDDMSFYINDFNVGIYGSQGQQRTTALSVKLAEIELIKQEVGEYPVLLLDDVLSELDQSRQSKLLTTIRNRVQTFVTTPSISGINHSIMDDMYEFVIENGKVLNER